MVASSGSVSMSAWSMCSHPAAQKSSAWGRWRMTSWRRMQRSAARSSAPRGSRWAPSLASWLRGLPSRPSLPSRTMWSMILREDTRLFVWSFYLLYICVTLVRTILLTLSSSMNLLCVHVEKFPVLFCANLSLEERYALIFASENKDLPFSTSYGANYVFMLFEPWSGNWESMSH